MIKKQFILLVILAFSISAQLIFTEDTWAPVGNVELKIRWDDLDNGDGLNDGALEVNGLEQTVSQGITYTFNGSMLLDENYSIKTVTYKWATSFVKYRIDLFNLTDDTLLASSDLLYPGTYDMDPDTTILNYVAQSSDLGDIIQLRYLREDDGNIARDFAIDFATLNDSIIAPFSRVFIPKPILDISSTIPSAQELADMDRILSDMSDYMLGTSAPSSIKIDSAVALYDSQQIVIENGKISGKDHLDIYSWEDASYLMTFAQHLKYNPEDISLKGNGLNIVTMVKNTIWLFCHQFHTQQLPLDYINYFYKLFAAPAVYLRPYLDSELQNLFYYSLYRHSSKLVYFWAENYVYGLTNTRAINMDDIGNISNIQLAYGLMQDSATVRLQWTKGFKRYYERFMTYSPGTADGIKLDGSGFHHYSALNNYTYNYNTPMKVLKILDGSVFQVSEESYLVFRDGIYAQLLIANDNVEPLSMCGRHPETRQISPRNIDIADLAVVGGNILGLGSADPILASAYVRHWGDHANFPGVVAENLRGFTQLNYHTAGLYWKDNWMAVARGFTDWGFGAEKIRVTNCYGRYQSYGALEILYSGGQELGNGFRVHGWNWNYSPGATSIVLPWDLLKFENVGQKEYQRKGMAGSLAFINQNQKVLSKTRGELGVFAMDFLESTENHGSDSLMPNSHDSTFEFKKSVFFMGDYILALGSGICNDDSVHNTITTLYQRLSEQQSSVIVENVAYTGFEKTNFSDTSNYCLVDNFNTGYYVVTGSGILNIQRENQQVPFWNQYDHTLATTNPSADYSLGYLDHGIAPKDASYEYVVKPAISKIDMEAFATSMIDSSSKPYIVHQKDSTAHIIYDKNKNIAAYAFFGANDSLNNDLLINSNSASCLVMYKKLSEDSIILAISNPSLELEKQSANLSPIVPIQIILNNDWIMTESNSNVSIIGISDSTTTLDFKTTKGLPIEITLKLASAFIKQNINKPKEIFSIFPNPFNPTLNIFYNGKVSEKIQFSIYNMHGRLIHFVETKNSSISWNASKFASGSYMIKITNGTKAFSKKVILLK